MNQQSYQPINNQIQPLTQQKAPTYQVPQYSQPPN